MKKLKHGYYDIFISTCAKNPSRVAVRVYDNGKYKTYTYSELYGVCEYLAQNIQQITQKKGIIGLVTERNAVIPCVIAAAHRCSTTFMFIDPSQDIKTIIRNTNFNIILHIQDERRSIPDLFPKKPDKNIKVFNLEIDIYNFSEAQTLANYEVQDEHSYIAMTSGSTGDPKQILVPIKCIQPNIDDLTKLFDITPHDVIYFSTPLTFDPSMIEILLACINGASLLIAPEQSEILFPMKNSNSVTFWQTTPSKFFQYTTADIKNKILSAKSTLKILALGGEPLNGIRRLKELKDLNNKTKIFTLYGVTEMSCWACVAELDLTKIINEKEIPLGHCLSETQLIVKNSNKNSNMGNIVLASKTRQCFILNKSNSNKEDNILKSVNTGDIGKVKNGTVYYRGRKDDVIKRFGHKVNLLVIENVIMQCPRVKASSVVWLPKLLILVVYFSSETLNSQELTNFLKSKLDEKQWPDKIIRVDNMPMNCHGKTSKRLLSQLLHTSIPLIQSIGDLKQMFVKELNQLLNSTFTYEDIKDKSFFSIGGTSFYAISMCNKLSLCHPEYGKIMLPYLINQNLKIYEVIDLVSKTIKMEMKKTKKILKRTVSNVDSSASTTQSCKALKNSLASNPVDYKVVWAYNTGKCVDASPTLFKDGHKVYATVGSHSGRIVVVDAVGCIAQGVVDVNSRVEASVLCSCDPPLTTPCGIVGTYDGTIVCFSLQDGKEIWKINVGSMIKSKAACCDGNVYVASYDGCIRFIDILTGEVKGSIRIADQAISADLVLAKNQFILVGTLSGACAAVHVESKSVAWRGALNSPVFASPVLYDCEKYVVFAEVNGEIHCRTVEKGIKIWRYQGTKGNIFSSMYFKELDKLKWQMVFGCHDDRVYSVIIKNFQPSLHWKTQVTSPVYSTPCHFKDKYILAASNNGVLCILDSENGSILSEHRLPGETFSSPAVSEDYVFIGCRDDYLYSIKCIVNKS